MDNQKRERCRLTDNPSDGKDKRPRYEASGMMDDQEKTGLSSLFHESWFLEKLCAKSDSYDLLDCSLVCRSFMRVVRRLPRSYLMQSPESLACLSNRIVLSDALTLQLGEISGDLSSCGLLPFLEHLTMLCFDVRGCSLGFKGAQNSGLVAIKELMLSREGDNNFSSSVKGISALTNLESLTINKPYSVDLEDIIRLPSLTSLDVASDDRVMTSVGAKLCSMTNLHRFVLREHFSVSTHGTISEMMQLTQLTCLEILDRIRNPSRISDAIARLRGVGQEWTQERKLWDQILGLSHLSSLHRLEVLKLDAIVDHKNDPLLNLSTLTQLTRLDLEIDVKQRYSVLASLSKIPSLRSLSTNFYGSESMRQKIRDVLDLTQLTSLSVRGIDGSIDLDDFKDTSNLTKLDLLANEVYFSSASEEQLLPNLATLEVMVHCDLDYHSFFGQIGRISNLRELSICCVGLQDVDFVHNLNELSSLTSLSVLRVTAWAFVWNCLHHVDAKYLCSLKKLCLLSCEPHGMRLHGNVDLSFSLPEKLRWLIVFSELLTKPQEIVLLSRYPLLRRITRV